VIGEDDQRRVEQRELAKARRPGRETRPEASGEGPFRVGRRGARGRATAVALAPPGALATLGIAQGRQAFDERSEEPTCGRDHGLAAEVVAEGIHSPERGDDQTNPVGGQHLGPEHALRVPTDRDPRRGRDSTPRAREARRSTGAPPRARRSRSAPA
jgi:hypothetical protein